MNTKTLRRSTQPAQDLIAVAATNDEVAAAAWGNRWSRVGRLFLRERHDRSPGGAHYRAVPGCKFLVSTSVLIAVVGCGDRELDVSEDLRHEAERIATEADLEFTRAFGLPALPFADFEAAFFGELYDGEQWVFIPFCEFGFVDADGEPQKYPTEATAEVHNKCWAGVPFGGVTGSRSTMFGVDGADGIEVEVRWDEDVNLGLHGRGGRGRLESDGPLRVADDGCPEGRLSGHVRVAAWERELFKRDASGEEGASLEVWYEGTILHWEAVGDDVYGSGTVESECTQDNP